MYITERVIKRRFIKFWSYSSAGAPQSFILPGLIFQSSAIARRNYLNFFHTEFFTPLIERYLLLLLLPARGEFLGIF